MVCAALAAPPTDAAKAVADTLHKQALEAARAGDWDAAFPLWDEAQARHQLWKYPFNQASGYNHKKRWLAGWRACERAWRYGVPHSRKKLMETTQKKAHDALLKNHALVEITVFPASARVIVGGNQISPPWRVWLRGAKSEIEVSAPGHISQRVTIDHPIGKRTIREVRLEAL
jgi:hypothetical protein